MKEGDIVYVGPKRSDAEKNYGPESLALGACLICAICGEQVIFSKKSIDFMKSHAAELGVSVSPMCLQCAEQKIDPELVTEVAVVSDPELRKAIAKERAEMN